MQLAFFTQQYVLGFCCQKIKIFVIIVNGYIIFYHAAIYSRESPFLIFIFIFFSTLHTQDGARTHVPEIESLKLFWLGQSGTQECFLLISDINSVIIKSPW